MAGFAEKMRNKQANANGTTTPNWTQPHKQGSALRWVPRFFKFIAAMVLGYFMLTNWQPWLMVAEQLASMIQIIPFLDSLIAIPYLGGWIEWILANLASLVGLLLWAAVQFVQVTAIAVKDPQILGMWIEHWDGRQFAIKGDGSSIDQLKVIFNNFPIEWLADLRKFRAQAYALEIIVAFLAYPPYEGGIEAIVADAPHWDPSLILWWKLVAMAITVVAFERCLIYVLKLWQGLRYFR